MGSTKTMDVQDFPLWDRLLRKRTPLAFELELTARCNNDCKHCYINLPAGDSAAQAAESTAEELLALAREAVDMGAVWCLLTGGEPFLRKDFEDIYLGLKRLGLLVSVFTNACLVTSREVELLRKYPPRDLEVTVYGATRETYEAVTRRPGSWDAFNRGLQLLLDGGVKVRLKAMILRSNLHEFEDIARYCRERTKDYYRFDPLLHLRYDQDARRNRDIMSERLSPAEIVEVERSDPDRFDALEQGCDWTEPDAAAAAPSTSDCLFYCGAGRSSFTIGWDGTFRLCSSLNLPETVYDLRAGSLSEAWGDWVTHVRSLRAESQEFLEKCGPCRMKNLCQWCPAHAALESGAMDDWVEYFCEVAHARAEALVARASGRERK